MNDPTELAWLPEARQLLGAFVVRARRVADHSLAKDPDKLLDLSNVTLKILIENMPEGLTWITGSTPDEELMESLAARVRPLLLKKDEVYYGRALKAMKRIASHLDRGEEFAPIDDLRELWRAADPHENGTSKLKTSRDPVRDGEPESVAVTDRDMTLGWFYGDLVHASAALRREMAAFGIDRRFRAAFPRVAEVALGAVATLAYVRKSQPWLEIPDWAWEEKVFADRDYKYRTQIHLGPVGTDPPRSATSELEAGWTKLTPEYARQLSEDFHASEPDE